MSRRKKKKVRANAPQSFITSTGHYLTWPENKNFQYQSPIMAGAAGSLLAGLKGGRAITDLSPENTLGSLTDSFELRPIKPICFGRNLESC